jgi:ubiquinone/menaquinone biosynthesis C-methylase UbiE
LVRPAIIAQLPREWPDKNLGTTGKMTLQRILEPEFMDTVDAAIAYDSMDHADVNRIFVTDLLDEARDLLADASRPAEVLDLGTGTAQIPIELCRRSDGVRVLAVDAATSMLDAAIANIDIASLRDRIRLAHVDAKQLPYDAGRFPIVMSNSIVHHIPDPLDVLREAVRVAAGGGLVFFRDLLRPPDESAVERLVTEYAGTADQTQQKMFADSLSAALTLDEVRSLVAQLGFAGETVRETSDRHWTWIAWKQDR